MLRVGYARDHEEANRFCEQTPNLSWKMDVVALLLGRGMVKVLKCRPDPSRKGEMLEGEFVRMVRELAGKEEAKGEHDGN